MVGWVGVNAILWIADSNKKISNSIGPGRWKRNCYHGDTTTQAIQSTSEIGTSSVLRQITLVPLL